MAFLLWDTIKSHILGAWSWLDDPIEGLWDGFRTKILGRWSWLNNAPQYIIDRISATWGWLNTIDDKIREQVLSRWTWLDNAPQYIIDRISATWGWLNTIDDRIRDTVSSTWTTLNTLDDRIRDIAWSHIAPKLGDWLWSFIVLEVTLVSKIGYRVLHSLWDMEWDDANKEAK